MGKAEGFANCCRGVHFAIHKERNNFYFNKLIVVVNSICYTEGGAIIRGTKCVVPEAKITVFSTILIHIVCSRACLFKNETIVTLQDAP